MKTLSHGFDWLRRLAFVLLLMGIAGNALAAKTYTNNGDGTVTDPTTGLIWMRCAMGQTWDGKTCTGTASIYTFDQANALSGKTTYAGKSDWRVPNIRELQTIVDRSVSSPAIDSVAFPNTSPSSFWSASAYPDTSKAAWIVHFGSGTTGGYILGDAYQVRLARVGLSSGLLNIARPDSDYVEHADGTVTHTPTGLMWQSCAVGQTLSAAGRCTGTAGTYTWDQAMQLKSSLGGKTDWRLPTEEELISLVAYNVVNPSINTQVFRDTPTDLVFWSASSAGSSLAWFVYFGNGGVNNYYLKSNAYRVRLVRTDTLVTTTTTTVAPTTTTTVPVTTTTASVTTTTVVSTTKTYTDNGDGTVTDPTTGLIWMRCEMGKTWSGTTCTGTGTGYTFDQANALTGKTT